MKNFGVVLGIGIVGLALVCTGCTATKETKEVKPAPCTCTCAKQQPKKAPGKKYYIMKKRKAGKVGQTKPGTVPAKGPQKAEPVSSK